MALASRLGHSCCSSQRFFHAVALPGRPQFFQFFPADLAPDSLKQHALLNLEVLAGRLNYPLQTADPATGAVSIPSTGTALRADLAGLTVAHACKFLRSSPKTS